MNQREKTQQDGRTVDVIVETSVASIEAFRQRVRPPHGQPGLVFFGATLLGGLAGVLAQVYAAFSVFFLPSMCCLLSLFFCMCFFVVCAPGSKEDTCEGQGRSSREQQGQGPEKANTTIGRMQCCRGSSGHPAGGGCYRHTDRSSNGRCMQLRGANGACSSDRKRQHVQRMGRV
jgi:hypothetical protein